MDSKGYPGTRSAFGLPSSPSTVRSPTSVIRMGGGGARSKGTLPAPRCLEDLPPPGTTRWVMRRKAEVVVAVRTGLLTLEDACTRYTLSVEEFLSWQELIDRHGVRALRATRVKEYRTSYGAEDAPDQAWTENRSRPSPRQRDF